MWKQPFGNDSRFYGSVILTAADRTEKSLLHISYTEHLCRNDHKFLPDELVAKMLHDGIAVRTYALVFRDIAFDFVYGKIPIKILTFAFW